MYAKYFKRMIDVFLSACALPMFVVLFIVVAPIIWIEDKGSIFYMAKRRGLNGKVFEMYKFRSMKMNAPDIRNNDNSTYNSASDSRVTKIGKLLRKTSLDEVPQILNILRGDMSIIGPRAPIPKDGYTWDDLTEKQQKRLSVRPGLTGYSQALYRNSISSEEKLEKDCFYVDHVSFVLDVKIFFWTIKSVLMRKNIYTN